MAHRCAAAQSVFEEGGLAVPDLIWQDTEEPGPGQLACLVYRFIAGDHYRPGNLDLLARGFANLARLHAIPAETFRDPYPDAMPPRSLDHDWPLRDDRSSDGDPAKSLRDLYQARIRTFRANRYGAVLRVDRHRHRDGRCKTAPVHHPPWRLPKEQRDLRRRSHPLHDRPGQRAYGEVLPGARRFSVALAVRSNGQPSVRRPQTFRER